MNNKPKRRTGKGWVIFFIIIIGATLPFHYVPERLKAFPKNDLTFSNTFIMQDDIDNLIKRYNAASHYEKLAMKNEGLFRKLAEEGIIYEQD